jgi:hypothetical protein
MARRSHQTGAAVAVPLPEFRESRRHVARKPTFPISRKGSRSANILALQVRKVRPNFILRHSASHVVKHVVHRNAQAAQARLTAEFLPSIAGSRDSKSCDVLVALVDSWEHADGLVQGPGLSP